jgi:hypothetical protein
VFAVATIAGCGRVEMNQWIASAPSAVLPMPWPVPAAVRLFATIDCSSSTVAGFGLRPRMSCR